MIDILVCPRCGKTVRLAREPWSGLWCPPCGVRMVIAGGSQDPWAQRAREREREEARREAWALVRAAQRPAWLAGLPDPPRRPHSTAPGRDVFGQFLPAPWFWAAAIRPPDRTGQIGPPRSRMHTKKCRRCGTVFTGFANSRWCSPRCRKQAWKERNRGSHRPPGAAGPRGRSMRPGSR
jgi:DNA-directed RNA polymerase subunit RPC12/RpoP